MLGQSIIAAIIPAAVYLSLIYAVDRYEKEPMWLLSAAFFWGAVPAILFALIFNGLLGLPFYVFFGESELADAAVASIVAPLVEESIKGAALLILLFFWRHQIDSLLDGIIYGAVVGIGFAMVENVFYFVQVFEDHGVEAWQVNIFMRAVVFGLNHSLYTAMTGLGIAIVRLRKESWRYVAPFIGWGLSVLLHFVHNATASAGGVLGNLVYIPLLANAWGGVFALVIIIVWSLWQERRWIRTYLQEEVRLATITPAQYTAAGSSFSRFSYTFGKLASGQIGQFRISRRFFNKCSKLAYLKHHNEWYESEKGTQRMEALRGDIARLSQQLT